MNDYISYISDKLTQMSREIMFSNKVKLYNKNIIAENLVLNLLNIVFDYNLQNINKIDPNAISIDLGDKHNGIAIQVTSDSTSQKVKNTIKKFIENELYNEYSRLIILNTKIKGGLYAVYDTEDKFVFNVSEDNIDLTDIASEVSMITDIHKLKEIVELLKFYFDNIPTKVNGFWNDSKFLLADTKVYLGHDTSDVIVRSNRIDFENNRLIIIKGKPGSGKSAFVKSKLTDMDMIDKEKLLWIKGFDDSIVHKLSFARASNIYDCIIFDSFEQIIENRMSFAVTSYIKELLGLNTNIVICVRDYNYPSTDVCFRDESLKEIIEINEFTEEEITPLLIKHNLSYISNELKVILRNPFYLNFVLYTGNNNGLVNVMNEHDVINHIWHVMTKKETIDYSTNSSCLLHIGKSLINNDGRHFSDVCNPEVLNKLKSEGVLAEYDSAYSFNHDKFYDITMMKYLDQQYAEQNENIEELVEILDIEGVNRAFLLWLEYKMIQGDSSFFKNIYSYIISEAVGEVTRHNVLISIVSSPYFKGFLNGNDDELKNNKELLILIFNLVKVLPSNYVLRNIESSTNPKVGFIPINVLPSLILLDFYNNNFNDNDFYEEVLAVLIAINNTCQYMGMFFDNYARVIIKTFKKIQKRLYSSYRENDSKRDCISVLCNFFKGDLEFTDKHMNELIQKRGDGLHRSLFERITEPKGYFIPKDFLERYFEIIKEIVYDFTLNKYNTKTNRYNRFDDIEEIYGVYEYSSPFSNESFANNNILPMLRCKKSETIEMLITLFNQVVENLKESEARDALKPFLFTYKATSREVFEMNDVSFMWGYRGSSSSSVPSILKSYLMSIDYYLLDNEKNEISNNDVFDTILKNANSSLLISPVISTFLHNPVKYIDNLIDLLKTKEILFFDIRRPSTERFRLMVPSNYSSVNKRHDEMHSNRNLTIFNALFSLQMHYKLKGIGLNISQSLQSLDDSISTEETKDNYLLRVVKSHTQSANYANFSKKEKKGDYIVYERVVNDVEFEEQIKRDQEENALIRKPLDLQMLLTGILDNTGEKISLEEILSYFEQVKSNSVHKEYGIDINHELLSLIIMRDFEVSVELQTEARNSIRNYIANHMKTHQVPLISYKHLVDSLENLNDENLSEQYIRYLVHQNTGSFLDLEFEVTNSPYLSKIAKKFVKKILNELYFELTYEGSELRYRNKKTMERKNEIFKRRIKAFALKLRMFNGFEYYDKYLVEELFYFSNIFDLTNSRLNGIAKRCFEIYVLKESPNDYNLMERVADYIVKDNELLNEITLRIFGESSRLGYEILNKLTKSIIKHTIRRKSNSLIDGFVSTNSELYNSHFNDENEPVNRDVVASVQYLVGYLGYWEVNGKKTPLYTDIDDLIKRFMIFTPTKYTYYAVAYNIARFTETYNSIDVLRLVDYTNATTLNYSSTEHYVTELLIEIIESDIDLSKTNISNIIRMLNRLIIDCSSVRAYLYKKIAYSKYL